MTMDRRQFLRATAAGTFAGLASTGCDAGDAYELQALAQPDLLDILGPELVREIGVHYREEVPDEDRIEALHAAILDARSSISWLPWAGRRSVAELVRDDFGADRTILINGWVLSATEARQCALFSLLSS